ncbi:MAG: DMT family transporter [Rhodobacteraceae bacterium]|nr:DMT family transporter [Paracoccaceae bacterium]
MERKDHIDGFGLVSLLVFTLILAFNQVVIKVVNDGFQPVFFAGLRSAGAMVCIALFLWARGKKLVFTRETIPAGILIGMVFSAEFLFLFIALDLTTVARTSVIFYSMPLWLALGAHLILPGERMTRQKSLGLALAFAGVTWAILDRDGASGGQASLVGDLFALLAAIAWAGIALCARGTKLITVPPETQLFWQLTISALVLVGASFFFGPMMRDVQPIHLWGMAFQIVVVASGAYLFWLWILTIYPASSVASFSFLTPIFGVFMGWALLGEEVSTGILGALVLVAVGIALINRPPRRQPETSAQTGR